MMNSERQIVFYDDDSGEKVIIDITADMMYHGMFIAKLSNGMLLQFDAIEHDVIQVYKDGEIVYETFLEVHPEVCEMCGKGIDEGYETDEAIFCSKKCIEMHYDNEEVANAHVYIDFNDEKDYYITFNGLTTKIEI